MKKEASDIPVAILCGGRGTRLGRESVPKALIEIGGRPILWHIMSLYAAQGFSNFILCLGFGADMIRDRFASEATDPELGWNIDFVDTGSDTQTGGRLKRIAGLTNGTFMATYGDGLARIDLGRLLEHHRTSGLISTITCARARIPFGIVHIEEDSLVSGFSEKPLMRDWINGGFFVFEQGLFDYLDDDSPLETEPFNRLVADRQMGAFLLDDFWACMDTYKEALLLNELWKSGAPWKTWQD